MSEAVEQKGLEILYAFLTPSDEEIVDNRRVHHWGHIEEKHFGTKIAFPSGPDFCNGFLLSNKEDVRLSLLDLIFRFRRLAKHRQFVRITRVSTLSIYSYFII